MRPPTQPMQCAQLYKQIKKMINGKGPSAEGSTAGLYTLNSVDP
jgi:hypothetical protein